MKRVISLLAAGLRKYQQAFAFAGNSPQLVYELSRRYEGTEKALESFASAMQEYARHMASHTSAIQGLSEASQSLKNSAAEQNQILYRLSHSIEADKSVREVSRVERVVNELEKRTMLVLQVKDELEGRTPATEPHGEAVSGLMIKSPPGCLVNPRALYRRQYLKKAAL